MVENLCGKVGYKGRVSVGEREGGRKGKREKDREFNLMCSKKETEKVKLELSDFLL